LLAFDGVVITLAGSRLRMKNLGHNFGQVRLLVYFLFCGHALFQAEFTRYRSAIIHLFIARLKQESKNQADVIETLITVVISITTKVLLLMI
jgi:hypothetical protein